MEKLSEKQTPDFVEMRKTLVGLGNVLIQAGLADEISCVYYPSLEDFSFKCGEFKYDVSVSRPYNEDEYHLMVENIKQFMREKVKNYEEQIFKLECAKAVMEVYLSESK